VTAGDVLGEGDHLRLVRRDGWEYVEHLDGRDSVAAFATTPAGDVVLIEQRRAPVGAVVLELPAGIVDPGETTEQAVVRELHEETGYTAVGTPTLLLSSPILASVTSSIHHVFHVACGPRTGPGGGLADEAITVRLVPLDGLDAALAAAAAVDWHLPAALHLARAHEAIGRR
jgi:ADP-ribose pyrophosphatase